LSKQRSSQNQRSQRNKLNALLTNQIDEDFSSEVESTMITAYRKKDLKVLKRFLILGLTIILNES
jgi:hypothetical protein